MNKTLTFNQLVKAIEKANKIKLNSKITLSGECYFEILINGLGMKRSEALEQYENIRNSDGTVTLEK